MYWASKLWVHGFCNTCEMVVVISCFRLCIISADLQYCYAKNGTSIVALDAGCSRMMANWAHEGIITSVKIAKFELAKFSNLVESIT